MKTITTLIADHIDIWTAAESEKKSGRGRASGNAGSVYGIKKLRELILELAVRGKLVQQDAKDEPAKVLLENIAKEKMRLIKEGQLKNEKLLPDIGDEEKTFEPPIGWEWVRFGTIAQHNSGKTLDSGRNTGQLRDYITTSNLYWGRFEIDNVRQMPIADAELEKCTAKKGDLLICEGGEAGRAAVWSYDHEVCFQNHVHRARFYGAEIDPYFVYRFFEKLNATGEIDQHRKGVGISNMSSKALALIALPLPPFAEQHRIVAKIDELMLLCDQLESQHSNAVEAHETLVSHLLGTLTQSQSAEEFSANWQRIAAHFDTLFTTDASIDALKQTLLQLAVMGKLVPQDPNDESAGEFLKKVAKEKARLINEGKIRKQKALSEINDDEIGFNLSAGWAVSRLGTFTNVGTGATPSRDKTAYWSPQEVNWVASGETSNDFITETSEKVSSLAVKETNVTVYPVGTLIVAMYGQGKTRGQVSELMIEAGTNQACAAVVLINTDEAHRKYLKLFFKKAYEEMRSHSAGGAQPNLNVGKISDTVVPLPPLLEQKRIVAKVDELMALCDALKARIKDAQAIQLHLADAIVEQAVC